MTVYARTHDQRGEGAIMVMFICIDCVCVIGSHEGCVAPREVWGRYAHGVGREEV